MATNKVMDDSGGARGPAPLDDAVLIAGPTASGKSALALDLARRTGGVIVNADSMQVYDVLRVVTARPGPEDLAQAPHLLYGHVHPGTAYSTGEWLRDVARMIADGRLEGRRAIFVGGTGLYFRALLGGLSDMPDVPDEIRARWRRRLTEEGAPALHRMLAARDPDTAASLRPGDGQRIARALEVLDASGRPIRHWQGRQTPPLVDPATATRLVLDVDRALLHARINARFARMAEDGALEEVARLVALELDPAVPAMKAIGVPELAAHLSGTLALDQAIERAQAATRQYAKRQMTWFRNQLGEEWRRVGGDVPEN